MRTRLLISTVTGLILAAAVMLLLPHLWQARGRPQTFSPMLPAPTGPYDVGVRRMRLTDTARADPWRPSESRTLMVDVHYPAEARRWPLAYYAVAQDMTELGSLAWAPAVERRLGLRHGDVNWLFRTHSHEWAPPTSGSFPVLIGSAPPGMMRSAYTGIAEELASRGYVVVTIDHPYDAPVVELFPTRRVIAPSDATTILSRAEADATRAADITYVSGSLDRLDPELTGELDLRHVGLFGWVGADAATLPGVSAVAAVGGPPTVRQPARPSVLVIGDQPTAEAGVVVPGAMAAAFTDDGEILAQLASRYPTAAPRVRQDIGDVQPLAYRTVRRYLVNFFDAQLRAMPFDPPPAEPGVIIQAAAP